MSKIRVEYDSETRVMRTELRTFREGRALGVYFSSVVDLPPCHVPAAARIALRSAVRTIEELAHAAG